MKLLVLIATLLQTISVVASAYPFGNQQQQQFPVVHGSTPSAANRIDTSDSTDSSSSRDSQRGFFDRWKLKHAGNFRCHSSAPDSTLLELAQYVTNLLKAYRDELFSRKTDAGQIPFETCLAGYKADEVSPSIHFTSMTKQQLRTVSKLLQNQVVNKFPAVRVVSTSQGLALVQGEVGKIKRRATM
ncbi:MAG: hypothetical protein Q9220_001144 [cf. Caloplaca sp. 1 TL-2023]